MRKVLASTALIAGVLMFTQAQAADQDLLNRIEVLEKKLENNNGGNFINSANKKVDVTLYGQVNKAVMFADDGENDDVKFVDNDASSSRIGIKAKTKAKGDWSAGAQFEVEYQNNDSNDVNMDGTDTGTNAFKSRQVKVYVKHKKAGKVTIGKGSTPIDSIAEIDFSGTKMAGHSNITVNGGGFEFWDDDSTGPGYAGVTVSDVFKNLDGTRKNMVRYDTPELFGLTLAVGSAEENFNDITLRYHKKLDLLEVKGGVGYTSEKTGAAANHNLMGSASVLFNFGLNVTLSAGNSEFADDTTVIPTISRDDASYIYGKVGYKFNVLSIGSSAVSVDYGEYDDFAVDGIQGTVYGFQFAQNIDDLNSQFYLGYRNMELDVDSIISATADVNDIQTVMTGVLFKF